VLTGVAKEWFDGMMRKEFVIKALEDWNDVNDCEIVFDHHDRIVLPDPSKRNVLITSALPYVNNYPHLGNIIGAVLSADVFARYSRLSGYNTLYICGTDEYGTATETKALAEGITCQELCDKFHTLHKEVYDWFEIDFDHFGRTTTPQQTKISQSIFLKCEANGFTSEAIVTQLYCEHHKSFLADRFVGGTCPLCGFDDASGDQCDKCGKLLNATELVNPKCKLDGSTPVIRDSKHIFLDLANLQSKCEEFVLESSVGGKWSSNTTNITNTWLKEGLKPRCITRDLKWGTKVPHRAGFEDKVFYVWFDAPIGYPSITANYTPDWQKWWMKSDADVKLYQFMGKDNVPFHTVIFPSTLIATGDPWNLVHHLNTTEYLQYEGTKFSKRNGVGVFGNDVVQTKIPVEVWRYYLLSNRPETSDSQFTWKSFIGANNNELLANLGNFVNRIIKFVGAKYGGVVPSPSTTSSAIDTKMIQSVNALLKEYYSQMEDCKIRAALKTVMDISSIGNVYLQENKLDNNLFANSRKLCDDVLYNGLGLVYLLSSLVYPFMPSSSASMRRQLGGLELRKLEDWRTTSWDCRDLRAGSKIGKAEYLFKMIDPALEIKFKEKYGSGKPVVKKPVVAGGGDVKSLEKAVADQASVVRGLKSDKAEAGVIKEAVGVLLSLKKELADAVGQ